MTESELVQLEALAKAATPGPRKTFTLEGPTVLSPDGPVSWRLKCIEDATFIAASREAVPTLIAEVRRLRALVHIAWEEAYDAGQHSTEGIPKVWLSSDARKALGAP